MENMNIEQLLREKAQIINEAIGKRTEIDKKRGAGQPEGEFLDDLKNILRSVRDSNKSILDYYESQMQSLHQNIDEQEAEHIQIRTVNGIEQKFILNSYAKEYKGGNILGIAYVEAPHSKIFNTNRTNFIKYEDLDKYQELITQRENEAEFVEEQINRYFGGTRADISVHELTKELNRLERIGISVTQAEQTQEQTQTVPTIEQTQTVPTTEQNQTATIQLESDLKEKNYKEMHIEELLQEQANVVQAMEDSKGNFTTDTVDKLKKIVDALTTKYKEEMNNYITNARNEIRENAPTILKRRDYDNNQNYYIAKRHVSDPADRQILSRTVSGYEKAYVEPPKVKGAPKNDYPDRFIKIEDLDKYKELVKTYDLLYEFRHDKLTPYIKKATGYNKGILNNAIKEMKKELESRGIYATSVEPDHNDEIEVLPENKDSIIPEFVRTQDIANIERQMNLMESMESAMGDLKDYIGQMQKENKSKKNKFENYKKSAEKNGNLERKLDLDNIVDILGKFDFIITGQNGINHMINNKGAIADIFKKIAELHSEIKKAKKIINNPEILKHLEKWEKYLERFANLGKEYIAQEESQRGRIPSGVQPEKRIVTEQNNNPTVLPEAKKEKSYENMNLEELEELLNKKKEERKDLWNTVVSAGDEATEEEKRALTQLDAEIKKIEEEIAKRREQERTIPNETNNSYNSETSYENMSLEKLEELLTEKKVEKRKMENAIGISGEEPSKGEKRVLTQLDAEIKKIEEEIAKRSEQERTIPTLTPTPTSELELPEEFRVEKRSAWQWIKDNKKQVLLAVGLSAVAVSVVAALQQLIPAYMEYLDIKEVSNTTTEMAENADKWWKITDVQQKANLHNENIRLAKILNNNNIKSVFENGSGIWKLGEKGTELHSFADASKHIADESLKKIIRISKTAGTYALGGFGLGSLLNGRSSPYKKYKEETKKYTKQVKDNDIDNNFYTGIVEFATQINNDNSLTESEKRNLKRKITKLYDKAREMYQENEMGGHSR